MRQGSFPTASAVFLNSFNCLPERRFRGATVKAAGSTFDNAAAGKHTVGGWLRCIDAIDCFTSRIASWSFSAMSLNSG